MGDLDITGDATIDATVGLRRAEELYDRVFFEYGDDSVAQLGGVHLACEQASNLLTKVLEWGRLMAYLEQSTRYIAYDTRLGGRYRYYRDPEVLGSDAGPPLHRRHGPPVRRLRRARAADADFYRDQFPKEPDDSDFVYRQAIRAKAFDAVRGVLPAASLSNVGIYGTGQGYEALLLRMRSHPLPESRAYADLMLGELRKVIPSFLKRVDLDDRGVAWSTYLASTRSRRPEPSRRRSSADREPSRTAGGPPGRLGPRRRGQARRRRCSTPTPTCRAPPSSAGPPDDRRRADRDAPGLRGRPGQPAPQARAGLRAPAYRFDVLATTAPSATSSATGC